MAVRQPTTGNQQLNQSGTPSKKSTTAVSSEYSAPTTREALSLD